MFTMKTSLHLLFAGLLHLSGAVALSRRADGIDDSVDGTSYIPNKYIVELSDVSDDIVKLSNGTT